MEKEFLKLVSDYSEMLSDNGVNMSKVRFIDKPIFSYDIENDNVEPINFYNGKEVVNGRIKKGSTKLFNVDIKILEGIFNDLELGVVIVLDKPLSKTYVDGDWVLQWEIGFLDTLIEMDSESDYMHDKLLSNQTIIEMVDSINNNLSNDSGSPIDFAVISEKTFRVLDNEKLVMLIDNSYYLNKIKIKVNSNIGDNLISLTNRNEVRVLKLVGYGN